jgi:putative two-component system response regulator
MTEKNERYSILAIDDESINFEIISGMLGDSFRLAYCSNGESALDVLKSDHVDLILVDYMMPGMDGLQFLELQKSMERIKLIPTVVITATENENVIRKAFHLGASDYISKPLRKIDLITRVSSAIRLARESESLKRKNSLLEEKQSELLGFCSRLQEVVDDAASDLKDRELEIINRLVTSVEFREAETVSHIKRIAHYSRLMASRIFSGEPERADSLFLAAPMHDIGKIGISDSILRKSDRLTEDEMAIMRMHCRIGYSIMKGSNSSLIQAGAAIALTHHEKYNGKGYPSGLRGEEIPIEGRIVAVADAFDSMTSRKGYREPLAFEEAIKRIGDESGGHFDPGCVEHFLDQIGDVALISDKYGDHGRDFP